MKTQKNYKRKHSMAKLFVWLFILCAVWAENIGSLPDGYETRAMESEAVDRVDDVTGGDSLLRVKDSSKDALGVSYISLSNDRGTIRKPNKNINTTIYTNESVKICVDLDQADKKGYNSVSISIKSLDDSGYEETISCDVEPKETQEPPAEGANEKQYLLDGSDENVMTYCVEVSTPVSKKQDIYTIIIDKEMPTVKLIADEDSPTVYEDGDIIYAQKGKKVILEANDSSEIKSFKCTDQKKECTIAVKDDRRIITPKSGVVLHITVTDQAGNTLEKDITFYIDDCAPVLEGLKIFTDTETITVPKYMPQDEYGYDKCFQGDTRVRISVSDGDAGCGVKSISFYTKDSTGKESGTETKEAVRDLDEEDSYYIETSLEDGFKGQLYVYASDFLGNTTECAECTRGIVVESQDKHDRSGESHIELQLPHTECEDSRGRKLYAGNVNVRVTVSDKKCGINSIHWSSKESGEHAEETAGEWKLPEQEGRFSPQDTVDGWKLLTQDRNLMTKLQKKLKVSGEGNDIVLSVTMEDGAGNRTTQKEIFSIDNTKPVISVAFDHDEADPDYPHLYDCQRTATITVKERNFSSSGMKIDITSSSGAMPQISEWVTKEDKKNPDDTVSTATVVFSEDGDYTMSVGGCDKVQNEADTVTVEPFTIDQTPPSIKVTFDNNSALNNNYYALPRTASICIKDQNFAPERVKVSGTLSNAGEAFPALGGWSQSGDEYTASFFCEADGEYQFDVECTDRAGNAGEKYSSESYYIDTTAPHIEITGVENLSANNGTVEPIVSITDGNYDDQSVNIQLTGSNRGRTDFKGKFTDRDNGQIFSFEDFPRRQEYDDLYSVNVEAVDLAGNMASGEITFSVNRYGSVYVFDNELKQLDGNYIPMEQAVRLTEINVDSLDHGSVSIVVDESGTPRDLKEDEDYTVQDAGGEAGWYRYYYDIHKEVFADDGRYIVTIYSEDRAGNKNQNTEETKKAQIRFGVDKTAPIVAAVNVERDRQYPVDVKRGIVSVKDNLVLDEVMVYVDGEETDYVAEGENYIFDIPAADKPRTISVIATDMAGNINHYLIDNVLVSTNIFALWYHNNILFIISLLCLLLALGWAVRAAVRGHKMRYRAAGLLLLPILAIPCLGLSVRAEEADSDQPMGTGLLQMVVFYTDQEGNEHPVQGGTGFLIGTASSGGEYVVTAKEVTSVAGETEQQLRELYGNPENAGKLSYDVRAVVKRDVMIDAQLEAESDEMGFAVWKLEQPLYDRQALVLSDEALTGVSGQKVTVLGFPTAPSLTKDTVYYAMEEAVSKEGLLIGDGNENNIKYLYHNLTPNAGMLGGPILNENGDVIALNQSRQAQEGYYALQVSELLPVLEALGIPYVTSSEVEAQRQAQLAAVVHKEELISVLAESEGLEERHYTKKSFTAFREALEAANAVRDNDTATQGEVDAALDKLREARDNLKEKPPLWMVLIGVLTVSLFVTVIFMICWKKSKPLREQKRQKKLQEFTVTQAAPKFEETTSPQEDYRALVQTKAQEIHQTDQTGPIIEEDVYGETTVFPQETDNGVERAYFIRRRTGEKIVIAGKEFVMGKEPSQTDYCIAGNPAISRVHAVVLSTGTGYAVSDKNATNGTFVNNIRVEPFQKISLRQGDILRLADEEFEFRVSSGE